MNKLEYSINFDEKWMLFFEILRWETQEQINLLLSIQSAYKHLEEAKNKLTNFNKNKLAQNLTLDEKIYLYSLKNEIDLQEKCILHISNLATKH